LDGRQYYIVTERLYCGDSDKIVAVSPPLPLLLAEPIMEGAGGGCVVGGVAPLGQVEAGQDAGLAGHSRVDLVVGQHHGVHLNILKVVRVVAKDAGELDAPDLVELLESEAGRPAAVLVPEPVAVLEVVELLTDDAGEGGADH